MKNEKGGQFCPVRCEGFTYLEHLDECHTEVEVALVTADQAGAEENSDWNDSSEIDAGCHPDCFSAIEERCGPCQDLGHHR